MSQSTPKYQQIANELIRDITASQWQPGEKAPSLRQLSFQYKISITTAIRCYEYLQDHGYLEAHPRSGFIVQPLPNTASSPRKNRSAPQFSPQVRIPCLADTPDTFQTDSGFSPNIFSSAQIAPELLPTNQLNRCMARMQKYNQGFLYGDPMGEYELREQLSLHYSQQGLAMPLERLLVTNGCMDAVTQALELLTQPGDIIAVNSPCHYGLIQLLRLMQRKIIEIPSTPTGLNTEALERAAYQHAIKACVFNATHQNPSGDTLMAEQKQWLAEFANRRKIPLIEDDVFIDLSHKKFLPLPIKHWDSNGYVIWCSSISKTLAPGLRIGWCDGGRFSKHLQAARQFKSMGVNRPLQQGLAEFFRNGHYRRHIARLAPKLAAQIKDYQHYLTQHLPQGSTFSLPSGGTTLWINIPKLNSSQLQQLTQGRDWQIIAGKNFSSRRVYGEYFRLNAGWPLEEKVKKSLNNLMKDIKKSLR